MANEPKNKMKVIGNMCFGFLISTTLTVVTAIYAFNSPDLETYKPTLENGGGCCVSSAPNTLATKPETCDAANLLQTDVTYNFNVWMTGMFICSLLNTVFILFGMLGT
jgi:hypothetical protein